jgi:hypothetical protein
MRDAYYEAHDKLIEQAWREHYEKQDLKTLRTETK